MAQTHVIYGIELVLTAFINKFKRIINNLGHFARQNLRDPL